MNQALSAAALIVMWANGTEDPDEYIDKYNLKDVLMGAALEQGTYNGIQLYRRETGRCI